MRNQTVRRIVGGHANRDAIPHDNFDSELLHFSGQSGRNGHSIVQKNLVIASTREVRDFPFELDEIISRQTESLSSVRVCRQGGEQLKKSGLSNDRRVRRRRVHRVHRRRSRHHRRRQIRRVRRHRHRRIHHVRRRRRLHEEPSGVLRSQ